MIANSRSASLAESDAVGSSMTISRALRTSARQMLISQFSAVDSPFTLGVERRGDADAAGDRRDVAGDRRASRPSRSAVVFGSAEHDVLEHGHAGHEGQFLVDEAHAERRSAWCGVVDRDRPAVDRDRAAVGMVEAGEDADQRRLAGAVGADEAVDLAGRDVEATRPSARATPPIGLARCRSRRARGAPAAPPLGRMQLVIGRCARHGLTADRVGMVRRGTRRQCPWSPARPAPRRPSGCQSGAGRLDLVEHLHHVVALGDSCPARRSRS